MGVASTGTGRLAAGPQTTRALCRGRSRSAPHCHRSDNQARPVHGRAPRSSVGDEASAEDERVAVLPPGPEARSCASSHEPSDCVPFHAPLGRPVARNLARDLAFSDELVVAGVSGTLAFVSGTQTGTRTGNLGAIPAAPEPRCREALTSVITPASESSVCRTAAAPRTWIVTTLRPRVLVAR